MQRRLRLRHVADFELLHRQGQRLFNPLAFLIIAPNKLELSRFGYAAGKSVGKAVGRNRAKRLLREAVRRRLGQIQPGWDCLFVARQPIALASSSDVDGAVMQLLRRAGLLSPEGASGEPASDPGKEVWE